MKSSDKCIGCESIKLVNTLGLCKRCNRHAYDFLSEDEIEKARLEHELMLLAEKRRKLEDEAKKEEAKAAETAEAEAAPAAKEGEKKDEKAEEKKPAEEKK